MNAGTLLQGSGASPNLTIDPSSSFDEDTRKKLQQAISMGAPAQEAMQEAAAYQSRKASATPTPAPQEDSGNFVTNNLKSKNSWLNLPTVGGVGGAAAGAAGGAALGSVVPGIGTVIGGLIGGVVGGFGGGAAGEAGRQKLNHEETDKGEILKQGAFGAAGEIAGPLIGKVGGKIAGKVLGGTGDLLTKEASEAALKGINPSKKFLAEYEAKHGGEDAAQTLLRHDLAGAGAQKIEDKAITPLQESFDKIVNKSGAKVDPNDLVNNFSNAIDKLKESPVKQNQEMATKLEEAFNSITDKLDTSKGIDISDINKYRKEFDAVTKDFAKDPAIASENRAIGDILRSTVQQTADKAGLADESGRSLKEVGAELSKLHDLHKLAALQDQAGRGKGLSLSDLFAGGVVSGFGGIPAAAAAIAAKRFSESPKVVGFLSKVAEDAGDKLSAKGSSLAINGGTGLASDIAGQTLPRAVTGQYAQPGAQPTPAEVLQGGSGASLDLSSGGMPTGTSSGTAPSSQPTAGGMSREDLQFLIQKDQAYTGGKNIDKYKKMYDALNPNPKLSDAAIGTVNDTDSALASLADLHEALTKSTKAGPIAGRISGLNPYDTEAQTLQAQVKQVSQIIGKALEGGKLTDQDALKYEKILPTLKDTPAVASAKIANVTKMLQRKQKDFITLQNQRGSGGFTTTPSE